jgi:hypothetical protein
MAITKAQMFMDNQSIKKCPQYNVSQFQRIKFKKNSLSVITFFTMSLVQRSKVEIIFVSCKCYYKKLRILLFSWQLLVCSRTSRECHRRRSSGCSRITRRPKGSAYRDLPCTVTTSDTGKLLLLKLKAQKNAKTGIYYFWNEHQKLNKA